MVKVRDQKIECIVTIIIGTSDSHAGHGGALATERDAEAQSPVREMESPLVDKKKILGRVVRYKNVREVVVADHIGDGDAQSASVFVGDASCRAALLETPVPAIVEE